MVVVNSRAWVSAILGAVALVATHGSGAATMCRLDNVAGPPTTHLTAGVADPTYSQRFNKREMTAQHGLLSTGQSELGLTTSDARFETVPKVMYQPMPDGRSTCVVLTDITVVFVVDPISVDIASDYQPGSCAYAEILGHENQHVQFARDAMDATLPEVTQRISAAVQAYQSQIVAARTGKEAADMVIKAVSDTIQPAFVSYQRLARELNGSIDTPQSYAALHARCRDW